jgi:ribonuclease BN (tRNA processing enzyme)
MRTIFPFRKATLAAIVLFGLSAGPATAAAPAVKVITLGTGGGPLTRLQRAESSNALIIGDVVYVIDCGDRCMLQLAAAHIAPDTIRAIFFTHYHQDHVGGLAPLLGIRWMTNVPGVLKLIGPPGLEQIVKGYRTAVQPSVDAGFGQTPDPIAGIEVHEVGTGVVYQDDAIKVLAVENDHYRSPVANPANAPKSYSYRFESPAGAVVFTGDTGPSPAVTHLAKGADLLVSEVIDLQGTIRLVDKTSAGKLSPQVRDNVVRHLTDDHLLPGQVGEMAKEAGVKQVVLSHLSPGDDNEDAEAVYGRGVRAVFKGSVSVAKDLQTFTVGAGR